MTHYQKLDVLLNGLLSRVPHRNTYGSDNSALTFEFLCSALLKNENVTNWEMKFLQDRLVDDGYVEIIEENNVLVPIITQKGVKFMQDGGYKKEQERRNMQDELVRTSIESNKRSKIAVWIASISLVVAILALVFQIINKC